MERYDQNDKISICVRPNNTILNTSHSPKPMKLPSKHTRPIHCPHGQRYISWTRKDDRVCCWNCDREYGVDECWDGGGSLESGVGGGENVDVGRESDGGSLESG